MREPIRDKNRLLHIQDSINIILERTEGMSYDAFIADKIQLGGIIYYTMIIGEAAYKLSRAFVDAYPQVEWDVIANMRHHIVHGYYQVNPIDVWAVIQHDLHPLKSQIEQLLSTINWEEWEETHIDL
jgi:uncharacterized protein with HEPN domain